MLTNTTLQRFTETTKFLATVGRFTAHSIRTTASIRCRRYHRRCYISGLSGLTTIANLPDAAARRSAWVKQRRNRGSIFQRRLYFSPAQEQTTIYAHSTPPGKSAVAVVRISGPLCNHIYRCFCPFARPLIPRKAALRTLYHPNAKIGGKKDVGVGDVLDPGALLLYFPAPDSLTGEDVLELHLHGGPAILRSVLAAIPKCKHSSYSSSHATESNISGSILPAEPGEFTQRAFYNSKLTLPQVEALGETLSAETELQRALSVRASISGHGRLSACYESWRSQLVSARAELEALIDFSEDQQFEESPLQLLDGVRASVLGLLGEMKAHVGDAVKGELLRNGIKVALLGAPNAGKSSLLNKIVGREAAIVSATPGTTRDVVDLAVELNGFMVLLGDTAGLRQKNATAGHVISVHPINDIEIEGMKRAEDRAWASDVIIVLIAVKQTESPDSSSFRTIELETEQSAIELARELIAQGKQLFVAINKIDTLSSTHPLNYPPSQETFSSETKYLPDKLVQKVRSLLSGLPDNRIFPLSCTSSSPQHTASLQSLLNGLTDVFREMTAVSDSESAWSEGIATTARQKALVEECIHWLEEFLRSRLDEHQDIVVDDDDGLDVDVVVKAEELRNAAQCLAKITGRGQEAGNMEEILGVIFQK